MLISYEDHKAGWANHDSFTRDLIYQQQVRSVCEIGGGANPLLPIDFVQQNNIRYTIVDISEEELHKAPEGYCKVQGNILELTPSDCGTFDLVISKMVAEHVADGRQFHQRVFDLLSPGGLAFHYFPTLCCPPLAINRLMPERLSNRILQLLRPGREKSGKHGKFPAFYSWCYGPTSRQIQRLKSLGYEIETYVGFFGHNYYLNKLGLLHQLHRGVVSWLLKHPIPLLTSGAYLVLRKPTKS